MYMTGFCIHHFVNSVTGLWIKHRGRTLTDTGAYTITSSTRQTKTETGKHGSLEFQDYTEKSCLDKKEKTKQKNCKI